MSQAASIIGQHFGRLTVIKRVNNNKWGNACWLCMCICGQSIVIRTSYIKNGHTRSCGCLGKSNALKHGHKRKGKQSKIYISWCHMIQRCTNPNDKRYKDYGGRRITICKRWLKFKNFLEDMGECPPGLTLERENNEKGYYKENCYWATLEQQARNRRSSRIETYNGESKCIAAWAEEYNIPYDVLYQRIYKLGWSMKRALTEPIQRRENEN